MVKSTIKQLVSKSRFPFFIIFFFFWKEAKLLFHIQHKCIKRVWTLLVAIAQKYKRCCFGCCAYVLFFLFFCLTLVHTLPACLPTCAKLTTNRFMSLVKRSKTSSVRKQRAQNTQYWCRNTHARRNKMQKGVASRLAMRNYTSRAYL